MTASHNRGLVAAFTSHKTVRAVQFVIFFSVVMENEWEFSVHHVT
jgi:hypothetical protein